MGDMEPQLAVSCSEAILLEVGLGYIQLVEGIRGDPQTTKADASTEVLS